VHLAWASDLGYLVPTAVAIRSALEHLDPDTGAVVHVLYRGLRPCHLAMLARVVGTRATLAPLSVDDHRLRSLAARNPHGYPAPTLFRLLLPELLDTSIDRVLYLDGDLVVRRDLTPLATMDLAGAPAAAVGHYLPRERALGLRPGMPYVNTGVLLMDLRQWRERRLGPRMVELLGDAAEQLPFADQDAINEIIGTELALVDPRWNQLSSLVLEEPDDGLYGPTELAQLRQDPWIVHYSSRPKPWQPGGDRHPHAARWWEYHALTGVEVQRVSQRDRVQVAAARGAARARRFAHRVTASRR
jgi:lipopolysaccharide biosynthesis glycosyltransferase